jgi:type IV pilus assembly protein PilQ
MTTTTARLGLLLAIGLLLAVGLLLVPAGAAGRQLVRHRGRQITIDLVNADIHNVVRLFSDVTGSNFVLDDGIAGKVTVKLRRVPWRAALRAILRSRGLRTERVGPIIRIARATTLERERQARLDARRQYELAGPLRTWFVRPSYARAADLAPKIKQLLTHRGRVMVDERTNTLVIRDVTPPPL